MTKKYEILTDEDWKKHLLLGKENPMKIALSLFDGISCGQLALQRAGISVDYYLASEVDKAAIAVTKKNFPETKHIGDVRKVDGTTIVSPFILMGGSPCQSFSFAGKQKGMTTSEGEEITTLERYLELKKEGFEFEGQSYLFWEYVRILKETKPRYFLLENVRMAKKWEDVISNVLGVHPILINSALVSAQNRKRLYWTNIPGVEQPVDRGILLKDIIEKGGVDRDKSFCLDANYFRGGNPKQYFSKSRRQLVFSKNLELREFQDSSTCHHVANATDIKGSDSIKRIYAESGKSPTLTAMGGGNREPKILQVPRGNNSGGIRAENGKVGAITSNSWEQNNFLIEGFTYRKLTAIECERLQTVPDNYTDVVSNTQRYRTLGNGWTVDVIAHILSHIPEEENTIG